MRFPMHNGWGRGHQRRRRRHGGFTEPVEGQRSLATVEPGREVAIIGFAGPSHGQRRHLQAYGLLPGRRVRVLAQSPVTIVQIEETELAFEGAVAASVLVGD